MSILKKVKKLFTKSPKESPKKDASNVSKSTSKPPKKESSSHHKSTRKNDRKPSRNFRDRKKHSDTKNQENRSHSNTRPPKKAQPERPKKPFSELNLHPKVLEQLKENNFTHSTEVQERSIPKALDGKNIFCSSATGSGKTLSFLLPMIHKFYSNEIDQALIICPTREIAIQIQKNLNLFKDPSLTNTLVIGGTNMEAQKQALKQYPKILIATPGRLLDMLRTGTIWLQYTNYVVLDEADRMLDMGFEDDLLKIHAELSGSHQTVLFSATLFPQIKKMAERYASDYEEIVIGKPTNVATTIEHVVVEMGYKDKLQGLKHLVKKNRGKTIIFFNTIKETSAVTSQLEKMGMRDVRCIHSKIDQSTRERIINEFRSGKIRTLLASDVAARGIDIPNVELVINYDVPNNSEEYIHRVGRTGRAGNTGRAISFCTNRDKERLTAIEKLIKSKIKKQKSYRDL